MGRAPSCTRDEWTARLARHVEREFAHIALGVAAYDPVTETVIAANPAFRRIGGLGPREEIDVDRLRSATPEEDRNAIRAAIVANRTRAPISIRRPVVYRSAAGIDRRVEFLAAEIHGPDDPIPALLCGVIPESERDPDAAAEVRTWQPSAQPRAITVCDAALRIHHVGDNVARWGRGPEDLLGTSALQWTHPADGPALVEAAAEAIGDPNSARELVVRGLTPDARWVAVHCTISPITGNDGYRGVVLQYVDAIPSADPDPISGTDALERWLQTRHGARDLPPAVRRALHSLTPREREVLVALLDGHRVPGIGRRLELRAGTVRNHLSSVFRKLGVRSQGDLVDLLRGER